MAITKQKKKEMVERLSKELASSTTAIVGTFTKLTVAQDFELRKSVREAGGHYRVVKNKLASRAATGTKVEPALKNLKGVSSVAYTAGDPVSLAKAMSAWVEKNAEFKFKVGIIDGRLISVEEIDALAKLPSKEELFSKLLYLINAPAQRLATVINATGRNVAVVINQAVEQNKFAAAPAGAAPAPVAAVAAPATEAAAEPAGNEVAVPEVVAAEAPAATEAAPEAKVEAAPEATSEAASEPSAS
jgi:large subunit ribosomal protein L10